MNTPMPDKLDYMIRTWSYLDMVSPLLWKRSCSARLDRPWCAKCRKIASCSSADKHLESYRPVSYRSIDSRAQKTCLHMPISLWNRLSCPAISLLSQPWPERMYVCWGTFSKCKAYWRRESLAAEITRMVAIRVTWIMRFWSSSASGSIVVYCVYIHICTHVLLEDWEICSRVAR